ncbi:oligoendopeptidase F [Candidatus Kapabacteria bacterium]|nr:oligoendopeptidase F [Candidatus Kapabacteria bacterium]
MKYRSRKDIPSEYKWDIEVIYSSNDEWEKDFKFVEDSIDKYSNYEGKLAESSEILFKCLGFDEYIDLKLSKLHLYAFLAKDVDLNVSKYQSMEGRMHTIYSSAKSKSSFIVPEILEIPERVLYKWMAENEQYRGYKHFFDNLFRQKQHSLTKKEEKILALSSPALSTSSNAFGFFKNADLKYPTIKDENNEDVEITEGIFYSSMYSTNREYRERVYRNYYKPYQEWQNTLASLFTGNLQSHIFRSKARSYNSSLESALKPNNIPTSVYHNLIDSVNENVSVLHRWVGIKKRILGLEEIHPFDMYVTLFPESKKEYSYEEGQKIVIESLKPMGFQYIEALNKAFDNRRIDVYETPGKRSGAYSSGVTIGVDPYVLLNWTNTYNDVSTLTHEMGHNMHSYFTGKYQPNIYAGYPIFLAEVASITNENMLHDYMMSIATSKQEKLTLLESYVNKIVSTYFRQTQFAEYEMLVHSKTEAGESLNAESLTNLYGEIYKKYYGNEIIADPEEFYTWSRVPHFYYGFYVYQYATGLAASEVLAKQVLEEGEKGAGKVMKFLAAGKSNYAIDILKEAGVDLTQKSTLEAVTNKMTNLMNQIEELIQS